MNSAISFELWRQSSVLREKSFIEVWASFCFTVSRSNHSQLRKEPRYHAAHYSAHHKDRLPFGHPSFLPAQKKSIHFICIFFLSPPKNSSSKGITLSKESDVPFSFKLYISFMHTIGAACSQAIFALTKTLNNE